MPNLTPQEEEQLYGKPESTSIAIDTTQHEHYFIRKSASVFGCRDCHNGWPDGGKFLFDNGRYIGVKH